MPFRGSELASSAGEHAAQAWIQISSDEIRYDEDQGFDCRRHGHRSPGSGRSGAPGWDQRLLDGSPSNRGDALQTIQAVAFAGHSGEADHDSDNVVGQLLRSLWMTGSNKAADGAFTRGCQGAGSVPRLGVVAARTLNRKAASSYRVSGIAASGCLKHSGKRFRDGAPWAENIAQRNARSRGVVAEGPSEEAGLAPKGRVEAWWVDAEGFREIGDADRVVATFVKQALGRDDGLFGIEAARPATGTRRFCRHDYKKP
jgi:hypothetical protein